MKKSFLVLLFFLNTIVFGSNVYEITPFYGSLEKVTLNLNSSDIEKSQLLITSKSKKIVYDFASFDKSKNILTLSNEDLGYIVADLNIKHDTTIDIKQYDKSDNLIAKTSIQKALTTQLQMNMLSQQGYIKADKELNKIYKQIMKKYAKDKLFIKKLKASQRLWIKLKDANLEAVFPEQNKRLNYGSIYPLSRDSALEIYTLERIRFLKQFLE